MALDRYTPAIQPTTGSHHVRAELGALAELGRYELELSRRPGTKVQGKVFVKRLLGLTGMEVSLTRLAPGQGLPFLHRHRTHEELYVVVGGRGEMQVDGERFPLREGAVVRVDAEGSRAVRAAPDEELRFLCIQAKAASMPDDEAGSDGFKVDGLAW